MEWMERYLIELRDTWWHHWQRGEDVARNLMRGIHATCTYNARLSTCVSVMAEHKRVRSNMQSEGEGMGCTEWAGDQTLGMATHSKIWKCAQKQVCFGWNSIGASASVRRQRNLVHFRGERERKRELITQTALRKAISHPTPPLFNALLGGYTGLSSDMQPISTLVCMSMEDLFFSI